MNSDSQTRHVLITAQRLADGHVVYLDRNRHWVEDDGRAQRYPNQDATQEHLAWALGQELTVVGAYTIDIRVVDERVEHTSVRERLRAQGSGQVRVRLGYRDPEATPVVDLSVSLERAAG